MPPPISLDSIVQTATSAAEDFFRPPTPQTNALPTGNVNESLQGLIAQPATGTFRRLPMTWRTPGLGFIQMYLNPQSVQISERKVVSSTRTKAGFVFQYAGEDLTTIDINGTTGSSGIEGINILEAIYRQEQEAFTSIAESVDKRAQTAQLQSLLNPVLGVFGTDQPVANGAQTNIFDSLGDLTANGDLGSLLTSVTEEVALNMFDQPNPSLAALAANVEMFWQGQTFRGYFTSFTVNERADSPGLFEYTIQFIAYARRGVRRNFMPWHRQPYAPAEISANPLSYDSVSPAATVPAVRNREGLPNTNTLADVTILPPSRNNSQLLSELATSSSLVGVQVLPDATVSARSGISPSEIQEQVRSRTVKVRSFGAATGGKSLLSDLDLNDLIE
jgi:hypothetical protein